MAMWKILLSAPENEVLQDLTRVAVMKLHRQTLHGLVESAKDHVQTRGFIEAPDVGRAEARLANVQETYVNLVTPLRLARENTVKVLLLEEDIFKALKGIANSTFYAGDDSAKTQATIQRLEACIPGIQAAFEAAKPVDPDLPPNVFPTQKLWS